MRKNAWIPRVAQKYPFSKNLRITAQIYTPTLLSIYASGWSRFRERRRAYRSSNKVRVLMGPAWSPAKSLGTRGWNIDPIIDYLNCNSKEFVCDTFVSESELMRRPVDIVFLCKSFEEVSIENLKKLSSRGVRLIYSVADNSPHNNTMCYLDHPEYMELFDYFRLASPIQEQEFSGFGAPFIFFPPPVLNTKYKADYTQDGPLRLVWNGYKENFAPLKALLPVIKDVAKSTGIPTEIVLNTNLPKSYEDGVRIVPWTIETWEDVLISSDIALVIKNKENFFHRRKPPTKVMTYMAAGLPTICTPTTADEQVIRHGETAYAAFTEADWRRYLSHLLTSVDRRRQMGKAARESMVSQYSISEIAHRHELMFCSVLEQAARS